MNSVMNLTVDEALVRPVIEKQIQAAIVAQLDGGKDLLATAVTAALRTKVNSQGGVSNYSGDNKYDWLEVMASESIKEAAQQGLMEWLGANKEAVKKAVVREMSRPERKNSIAKAFLDCVESALESSFSLHCTVKLNGESGKRE